MYVVSNIKHKPKFWKNHLEQKSRDSRVGIYSREKSRKFVLLEKTQSATNEDKFQQRPTQFTEHCSDKIAQHQKRYVAGALDEFIRFRSESRYDWQQARPRDVLEWLYYIDSRRKGTIVVHDSNCRAGKGALTTCTEKEAL